MVSTSKGDIWGSSSEGLFNFDVASQTFSLFEQENNLFKNGTFIHREDGRVLFSNEDQLTAFYPDKFYKNDVAPITYITSIEKIGQEGKVILDCIGAESIELDAQDYHITINFAAINYNQANKNNYAYKLEGLQDEWHYVKKGKPVVYTNLEPKTYTFKVKASNNDGVWNEIDTSIKIIQQPSLLQSRWFQLLFLLGLAAIIIGAVLLYTSNIRRNNLYLTSFNDSLNVEIEERKKIEGELAHREKFLKIIMDSVPQFIYWVDPNFELLGGNRNILSFLQLDSEDQLTGKKVHDFPLIKSYLDEQTAIFKQVMDSQKALYNQISLAPSAETNSQMWLEQSYVPLRNAEGELMGLLVTGSNISKRIENEQLAATNTQKINKYNAELKESNRDLEQFAYIASHDLKEPLRIIGNFSGLLARNYKGKLDNNADEFINYIQDGAQRMSSLIQSLLTYSQIGKRGETSSDVDLNKLIEIKLFDLSRVIKERNAKVHVENLPVIEGEKEQIGMVFYNLINNAIKFNKSTNPQVHIKAMNHPDENLWLFSVKDNGIGIEPIFQKKIFEIFKRLHGKHEYEGTGIGLSVCQKIIFRHGGTIWLESEHGNGTTFFFTIAKNLASLATPEIQAMPVREKVNQ